jgi:hypothetical protein
MSRFVLYLVPKLFMSSYYLLTMTIIKYEHGFFTLTLFGLLIGSFMFYRKKGGGSKGVLDLNIFKNLFNFMGFKIIMK